MTYWQIALTIMGSMGGLGLFVFGAGYLVSQFRKGNKEDKTSVLQSAEQLTGFWKEQAEGYKIMMADKDEKHQKQINDLTKEVGELRGALNEKTASYEKLEKIFQGRSPEQDAFMKTMLAVAQQSQTFMADHATFQKTMGDTMSQILSFMTKINTHLEQEGKELEINATVSKKI